MDGKDCLGTAQLAGGAYVGYQGLKHGLPRALGIRTEFHTTSKANAALIKKAGNYLDPLFGGKNGWSEAVHCDSYIKNSKNFVHITGIHKDSSFYQFMAGGSGKKAKIMEYLKAPIRTISRKLQCLMYKTVGNGCFEKMEQAISSGGGKKEAMKTLWESLKKNIFHNNTKRFCIPGIDSHFNANFIPDPDDCMALKSSKPVKVFTNRFNAMIEGVKKFGLKGIKENKGRAAFGAAVVALGIYAGYKLISKGINNLKS